MNNFHKYLFLLLVAVVLSLSFAPPWGFFGHKRINRMAVFTLPPEMMFFYKKHIEYITEHSVDPDKRCYATKHESVRHYIDMDHWGTFPFPNLPRDWATVLMKYADIYVMTPQNDSLQIFGNDLWDFKEDTIRLLSGPLAEEEMLISKKGYRSFFTTHFLPQYFEDEWTIDCDSLRQFLLLNDLNADFDCAKVVAVDRFSEYGIIPYYVPKMQRRLTEAFKREDAEAVLRLSSEFGHYIGDSHVPLHTTENYNGQFTNQHGIHAFWESRIPELFADENFDFFVGKATYIDDVDAYAWEIVLASHAMLDSVLSIEKELSLTYPSDEKYCYEDRLGVNKRTQCKAYAGTYSNRLDGQIEKRMRQTILAVGSLWYTAWVDAGQPDLKRLIQDDLTAKLKSEAEELDKQFKGGSIKGRPHEN